MTTTLPFLDTVPADQAEQALAFAAHHAAFPYSGRQGVPGIDYAWAKPAVSAVKAAGDVFVAQYDSQDLTKNLTPERAHQLLAAGVKIVLVYEDTTAGIRGGRVWGQRAAAHADSLAKSCEVGGIPVYLACDYDAPPGDQGLINDALDGAAGEIGLARVGLYGGYWPLSRAKAAGKTTFLWGTPAWSGTNWSTSGLVPDIMQGAMVTVGGVQCDLDAGLHADYGQWPRPAAPKTDPPPSWHVWQTKGHTSLLQVAAETDGMTPASILRRTALKYGAYDAPISAYLNGVFAGTTVPSDPIPAGGRLWVRS